MWWPRSCSCRSLLNWTVWPRCRSGRVGSKPSLIRSGLPRFKLRGELALDDQLVGAALENGEMVVEVEGHGGAGAAARWGSGAGPAVESRLRPEGTRTMAAHKAWILAQSAGRSVAWHARAIAPRQWIALAVLALSGVAAFGLAPGTRLPAPPSVTVDPRAARPGARAAR